MAIFPKIQSPCPYKNQLATIMDGDLCRLCKRQVVDLSDMRDAERAAFLDGCAEEVCVSYRLPIGSIAAAAAIAVAAAAAPMAAAAQEVSEFEDVIFVGGIKDPRAVEYIEVDPVQAAADMAIPELPVVYEDDKAVEPAVADRATPAPGPVRSPAAS